MSGPVIHVAAPVDADGRQRCARCGRALADSRKSVLCGPYPQGASIAVGRGWQAMDLTGTQASCQPRAWMACVALRGFASDEPARDNVTLRAYVLDEEVGVARFMREYRTWKDVPATCSLTADYAEDREALTLRLADGREMVALVQTCDECGVGFERPDGGVRFGDRPEVFCSESCRAIWCWGKGGAR